MILEFDKCKCLSMKKDVIDALSGIFPNRIPSKETLNHPGIIEYVTGIDPFVNTPLAYEKAWELLGIDIHPALPKTNAIRRDLGTVWIEGNLRFFQLGVYPTYSRMEYCPSIEKKDINWPLLYEPTVDGVLSEEMRKIVPDFEMNSTFISSGGLPGEGEQGTVDELTNTFADFKAHFKEKAVQYHIYYTTLFMWPIVRFGWESFMMAAFAYPEEFNDKLWKKWASISRCYSEVVAGTECDVVFMHDDLVSSIGPVFSPDFYEKYIFPYYNDIFYPLVKAGKKIVYVCDGNLDCFLERLLDFPIDGLQYENPATSFDRILQTWGKAGRGFIGGISTEILTTGTPTEVVSHTIDVIEKGREYPGFIISSCGGLHGDIPLDNMIAYFSTRNKMGIYSCL